MTFRGLLMWIHLSLGLTGAVILAVVGVTGAYITFQGPLHRWLEPIPRLSARSGSANVSGIVARVESQFGSRRVDYVEVRPRGEATIVRLQDRTLVFVDPGDASIVAVRHSRFASLGNLTALMRRLHTNLVLGPKSRLIVTFATAEALFLALTGAWLWWRKKHWQFRAWRGSPFRVSWDLHNATGIWFLVPLLSMALTGVLISLPSPIYRVAGAEPAPWLNPPFSSADTAGRTAIPLPRAVGIADSAVAGPIVSLAIPLDGIGAFHIRKERETVYVDRFSGSVIEVRPHRAPTAADDAYQLVEALHTGELLGLPGRAIMTLGSLMLAMMAVTGVVLGWKRLLILAWRWVPRDSAT